MSETRANLKAAKTADASGKKKRSRTSRYFKPPVDGEGKPKKFSSADQVKLAVRANKADELETKIVPPLHRYFADPLVYWQAQQRFATELLELADARVEALEATERDARLELMKEARSAEREAKQVEKAVDNPDVAKAYASDPAKLAAAFDSPEALNAFIAQLQAGAGEGGDK